MELGASPSTQIQKKENLLILLSNRLLSTLIWTIILNQQRRNISHWAEIDSLQQVI
jgi:hypothetical protein